ncbi:hypothetical protein BWZ22_04260 [Seonamhaeicola sp. S2-3]|uniref:hypothetical protein n=1 Tax=Seonamhaeicola sp. S2-3 TaxID=1936081 RepID=UPI000972A23E|nr:hypothetical protein [Seonamhaeicola sp. S2-3]APY10499.1 hypothetical protein BWZ22_04260 [Seonamhaeicola sp. S2-3]
MKTTVKIIAFTLTLILFNCKKQNSNFNYKYSDKPTTVACEISNENLYKEALYAFEDDILNFYGKNKRATNSTPTLTYAYNQFIRTVVYSHVPYESVVSKHTLDVFKALKDDNTLWDAENTKSHLNYNSPLIKCISKNIKDNNLKETFNSLLSVNDLDPKLFGAPLTTKYRNALNDKYLATYIAFDFYYSKLFDIDYSKINFDKPDNKVDFNKTP